MANETIMYMSVLLIGMITFGFFSTTFTTITDNAKDLTLETNLDNILEGIGSKALNLIATGESVKGQQSGAASFQLIMYLDLPASFSTETYIIALALDSNGDAILTARKVGATSILSTFTFGILNSTSTIIFSGFIIPSAAGTPYIQYSWDLSTESILLSNK